MLTKAGRRMEASLLFQGESYGWETQLLEGGDVFYGRRFLLKAGAPPRPQRCTNGWYVTAGQTLSRALRKTGREQRRREAP